MPNRLDAYFVCYQRRNQASPTYALVWANGVTNLVDIVNKKVQKEGAHKFDQISYLPHLLLQEAAMDREREDMPMIPLAKTTTFKL